MHYQETESGFEKRKAKTAKQQREREENREARAEPKRTNFNDPDEYREFVEDQIVGWTRLSLEHFASVETKNGFRYTLDPSRAADIINTIEAAAQQLRDVPVKVVKIRTEEEKTTARQLATSASTDALFQRFMKSIQPSPGGNEGSHG